MMQKEAVYYDSDNGAVVLISPKFGGVAVVNGASKIKEIDLYSYGPETAEKMVTDEPMVIVLCRACDGVGCAICDGTGEIDP